MDICLIADNPDTFSHPVLGTVIQQLRATHTVRLLDVYRLTGDEAIAREAAHPVADIYLLKSHTSQALHVAHHLEQQGALLINNWASSLACRDRMRMIQLLSEARLPCPQTWSFPSWDNGRGRDGVMSTLRFPLMVKSRYSCRGDLVGKVHTVEEFEALVARWNDEPFVLQQIVPGDGWDIKVWVIDRQIFAARRRTSLEAQAPEDDFPISAEQLPAEWRSMTREIGRVFHLRLYGADFMMTEHGPVVVDVNSFPGFRGVAGADSALISLVERLAEERPVTA